MTETDPAMPVCPACGNAMIQRKRWLLAVVGVALCAAPLIAYFIALLWVPAIVMVLAGGYLLLWATAGKGRWCRQCKTFR